MSKVLECSLVGANHRATSETLREIAAECPLVVEVRRERTNPVDRNAVAIYILEEPWKDLHIGYVPRHVAQVLAGRIDKGTTEISEAWLVELDPDSGEGYLKLTTFNPEKKSK